MSDIQTHPINMADLKVSHSCGEVLSPEWYLEYGKKVVYAHCQKCSVNIVLQRKAQWVKTKSGYAWSDTEFFNPPISLLVIDRPGSDEKGTK